MSYLPYVNEDVAASSEKLAEFIKVMGGLKFKAPTTTIQPNFADDMADDPDFAANAMSAPLPIPSFAFGGKPKPLAKNELPPGYELPPLLDADGNPIDLTIAPSTSDPALIVPMPVYPIVPTFPKLSAKIDYENHFSYDNHGPASYNYSYDDDYVSLQGVQTGDSSLFVGYADHYNSYGDGYDATGDGIVDTAHWGKDQSHITLKMLEKPVTIEIAPGLLATTTLHQGSLTYSGSGSNSGEHDDGTTHSSRTSTDFTVTFKQIGGPPAIFANKLDSAYQLLSQDRIYDAGTGLDYLTNAMNGQPIWDYTKP